VRGDRGIVSVSGSMNSNSYEVSPSMVNGSKEVFRDVKSLVGTWEEMEEDDREWVQEGGKRRGGRRISRRISELIRNFEDEEGEDIDSTVEPSAKPESYPIGGYVSNNTLTQGPGGGHGDFQPEQITNVGVKWNLCKSDVEMKRVGDWNNILKSKACDWMANDILSANSIRGRKRNREMCSLDDNCNRQTKKKRPGH
jgi:hypothetical protein